MDIQMSEIRYNFYREPSNSEYFFLINKCAKTTKNPDVKLLLVLYLWSDRAQLVD